MAILKVTEQFNSSDAVDVLADAIIALTGGQAALNAAIVAKKAALALTPTGV
jgi:hypothetical protein